MKIRFLSTLIFLLVLFFSEQTYAQGYGLHFSSYDSLKDQRTGVNLTPQRSLTFREDFELSFDISVHKPDKLNFGYICRVILNEEHNVDLIHRITQSREVFTLISEQNENEFSVPLNSGLSVNKWEKFRIEFLFSEDRILFHFLDTALVQEDAKLRAPSKVNIFFGANFNDAYTNTEVPPILIRDIKIIQDSKVRYHWPLKEYTGESASELIRGREARVSNPVWLRMEHMEWKPVQDISINGYVKIAADRRGNRIFFLGRDELVTFYPASGKLDTISVAEDPFLYMSHYQGVLNGQNILSYNQNAEQIITVDTATGKVQNRITNTSTRKEFLHHNKYLDTTNNLLYVLNGYGHYSYRNMVMICDIETNHWEEKQLRGNAYAPRYLAASGQLHDTIFVLGGYGSVTGNQRLNPQYFYDLNAVSLEDLSCTEIRSYTQPEIDFCYANSLVIDSTSRDFYALSFPKHKFESQLQLVKGSLDRKSLIQIGEPLPYFFNDINSYADLFYFNELEKMFAVTLYSKDYSSSSIRIYSIGYPTITNGTKMPDLKNKVVYTLLVVILILLTILILLFFWKRRYGFTANKKRKDFIKENIKGKITRNAIFFYGGFQVLDRNGIDITRKFTKLLKELFLLILFKSSGNSKGISSEKLIEILWFDKDPKSGKNNLSVNLAKLKEVLKDLDGCSIDHKTTYWKFIADKDRIFVEYLEVMNVIDQTHSELSERSLAHLLSAANEGQFLLNVEYEWLDYYKGKVYDKMVDRLISYADSLDPKKDSALIIQILNSVFNFDPVNEEAMILKCRTQKILGKHSLSKKTYENFCKEYEQLYGESFTKSFGSVIGK